MFAKTMLVGTVAMFYNFGTGFSAGYVVQDMLYMLYNVTSYGYYPILE